MKLDGSLMNLIVQSVYDLDVPYYECTYIDYISHQLIFSLKCESKVYFIQFLKSFDIFSCHVNYDFGVSEDVFSLQLYISPNLEDEEDV